MRTLAQASRPSLFLLLLALLAACGGGAGSGSPVGGGPPRPTPTPSTTTTRGTLVDDASGAPLAGVTVRLDPWTAYPTPGPTPTPISTTTTDANGHFVLANVNNGTYLLVIGSDAVNTPPPAWTTPAPSATDTPIPGASGWRATIHDRIVLSGGGTLAAPLLLAAPTMPPQPLYASPATETSGAYRLATLSALTEAPCVLAFNAQRQARALPAAVVDEWLVENTRAIAFVGMQPGGSGQTVHFVTSGNTTVNGAENCANGLIAAAWPVPSQQSWLGNPQTLWFGGLYSTFANNTQGFGAAGFPVDARVRPDPNGLVWP